MTMAAEIVKFKCDKDAFAKRLSTVIQDEIDMFIAAGGIHPEGINVRILRTYTVRSADPQYVLGSVEVSFVL